MRHHWENQENITKPKQKRSELLWLLSAGHVIESEFKPDKINNQRDSNTFPPQQITLKSFKVT